MMIRCCDQQDIKLGKKRKGHTSVPSLLLSLRMERNQSMCSYYPLEEGTIR